jgi:hypothetical protein
MSHSDQIPFAYPNLVSNPEPRCPCLLLLDTSGSMNLCRNASEAGDASKQDGRGTDSGQNDGAAPPNILFIMVDESHAPLLRPVA